MAAQSVSSAGPHANAMASSRMAIPSVTRPAWTWANPASASAFVSRLTSPKRRARSRASSAAASSSAGSSTSHPMAATATQPCSTQGGSSSTRRQARAYQARAAVRFPRPLAITSPRRDAGHRRPAAVAGGGEGPHGGGQVGDGAVEVEPAPGGVGPFEGELGLPERLGGRLAAHSAPGRTVPVS